MFNNIKIEDSSTCKVCGYPLLIKRTFMQYENDITPDKETHAYQIAIINCGNKQCAEFGIERFGGATCIDEKNANHIFCEDCGRLLMLNTEAQKDIIKNGNSLICPCGKLTEL